MSTASEDTLIVTLGGAEDFEATRKRILRVRGVSIAEFNYFSHKLRVRFGGDTKRKEEIQAEIRKLIAPFEK
jgi:hypothetical protein